MSLSDDERQDLAALRSYDDPTIARLADHLLQELDSKEETN